MPRPPKKTARLYTRHQGGADRYYADMRPLGGKREALIPRGETLATDDPEIARALLAKRVEDLREQKRDATILGVRRRAGLKAYAAEHLVKKAKSGRVTEGHLADGETKLRAAIEYFGTNRDIASIGVEHVQAYAHWLAERSNGRVGKDGRPGTLSSTSQRQYLTALSNLFRRAQSEGIIRGLNPVAALMDKPAARSPEARWLEVWEAALLLEAARTYPYLGSEGAAVGARLQDAIRATLGTGEAAEAAFVARMRQAGKGATLEKLRAYLSGERIPATSYVLAAARVLGIPEKELHRGVRDAARRGPAPVIYPVIAALLLTGGRPSEVLGLEIGDVDFARETVRFRVNARRRLKTRTSARTVPLWPQLAEILGPYVEERRHASAKPTDLLFESSTTGDMLVDIRASLDRVAERAGWEAGQVRPRAFRHTYASARLQTLDHGHPVAERTVAGELGHGGFEMVRRVYGHLGTIRHRSTVVEYRIEQHREAIPEERLRRLIRVA